MKLRLIRFGVLLSVLFLAAHPLTVEAQTQSPNCRFGMTAPLGLEGYDLKSLGVGSYLDWRQTPAKNISPDIGYVHVIRLRNATRQFVYDPKAQKTFEDNLKRDVQNNLGGIWLVGNEPDTNFDVQDAVTASDYALAYHHIYTLIKTIDPRAQIGIGTIVQPTPLRLVWLDKMFASYRAQFGVTPPSEFWSIHNFILREKFGEWGAGIPPGLNEISGELRTLEETNDLKIFRQRLFNFRLWMAENGQRHKPLWITEYGSLLPHDGRDGLVTQPITKARDYMLGSFDILREARDEKLGYPPDNYQLVQRWYWYSLNDDLAHFGGSLYDPKTKQRTIIGDSYVEYVAKLNPQPQIKITSAKINERPREGFLLMRAAITNHGEAANLKPVTLTPLAADLTSLGEPLILSRPLSGCGETTWLEFKLTKPAGNNGRVYLKLDWEGGTQTIKVGEWKMMIND